MKRSICLILSLLLVFSLAACGTPKAGGTVVLSTTTSVNDSGLMDVLQPAFEKATGITLKILSQGSGQAIKTGTSGDCDVLLVHSKADEEKFVADGDGIKRIELMYNYFVVAGPKDDPAAIKGMESANDAFTKIKDSQSVFVSRGDESGTNKKELSIWKQIGYTPGQNDTWYLSAGKGMLDCLKIASEKKGYVLTDKATFLKAQSTLDLDILVQNAKELKNTYTLIAVNPEKHKGINNKGAQAFIDWMTGAEAKKLISEYGKKEFGESLFTLTEK
ncbi:MAG: substrate-binding domain-containing protein [Clostridia bacterium]|nr:substrate-binding domain-containing protein [Clostridia bacterium]